MECKKSMIINVKANVKAISMSRMINQEISALSLSLSFSGVLWLCIVAECLYIVLLFTGGAMMVIEMCPCFNLINRLKLNAFAALCTALSGNSFL